MTTNQVLQEQHNLQNKTALLHSLTGEMCIMVQSISAHKLNPIYEAALLDCELNSQEG